MGRDIDQALAEVEREIHVRIKCFDRWVADGKLSWVDAFDRMERMISAVKHLRDYQTQLKLQELEHLQPGSTQPDLATHNSIPFNETRQSTAPDSSVDEAPRKFGA